MYERYQRETQPSGKGDYQLSRNVSISGVDAMLIDGFDRKTASSHALFD